MEPKEIAGKLESQLDELIVMYDLAESAYPYEKTREESRILNEDAQRRNSVAFTQYGIASENIVAGSSLWGLASVYGFSRSGAKHLLDFSQMRKCYARTFSWYMLGVAVGGLYGVEWAARQARDTH